jgi:hypothetical protein
MRTPPGGFSHFFGSTCFTIAILISKLLSNFFRCFIFAGSTVGFLERLTLLRKLTGFRRFMVFRWLAGFRRLRLLSWLVAITFLRKISGAHSVRGNEKPMEEGVGIEMV